MVTVMCKQMQMILLSQHIHELQKLSWTISIKNTLGYSQLIIFPEDEEFVYKVAETVQEENQLIENGFKHVCALDDASFFRKRK